jgi:hypothetical protein
VKIKWIKRKYKKIVKNYIAEHYTDINNINLGDSAKYISIKNSRFNKYENICNSIKL